MKYEYKNLKCKYCGQIFDSKTRNKNQKYCSKSCASRDKPRNLFKKNQAPWNKNLKGYSSHIKRDKKWCDNISKALKGKNAPNWKGGVSKKNELIRKSMKYKKWRKLVFERDSYTCQKCGEKSVTGNRIIIHPHHKKRLSEYPELAYSVKNGITLCYDCHQKEHKKIILSCKAHKIS